MDEEKVTLKEKLQQKLEAGEIDQTEYEELLAKFEDLDLLSSKVEKETRKESMKKRVITSGHARIENEVVEGPVKVSGRLSTVSNLKCESMSISGSASISGDLSVVDNTRVSGKLSADNDAKFGGVVKISGKLIAGGNIYCTDYLTVSGKVLSEGDVVLGADAKISGKLKSKSLRSTALFRISGAVTIENDLLAKEFISSGGKSIVGGNLQAERIEIAKNYREKYDPQDLAEQAEGLDSIPALGSFVAKMITSFIPSIINKGSFSGPPRIFEIYGDLRGNNVDISYTHIKGDLVADNVIIGPGVTVEGAIKYVSSIDLPEDHEFTVELVGEDNLLPAAEETTTEEN